ncbi:hypothetical protein B1L11_01010 [Microbispora sp. GKU 823]|nr:hypothetical protein B1L11_01010 [Microbispora sp. GKU 823]
MYVAEQAAPGEPVGPALGLGLGVGLGPGDRLGLGLGLALGLGEGLGLDVTGVMASSASVKVPWAGLTSVSPPLPSQPRSGSNIR